MSSSSFMNLVNQVIETARGGTLLSEEMLQSVLEIASPSFCQSEPETVALAVRQLAVYCDWVEFLRATKSLEAGVPLEDLHLEVERWREERETWYRDDPEMKKLTEGLSNSVAEGWIRHDLRLKAIHDAETLMGFDQGRMDELTRTLGHWDDSAVPKKLLDILPEDVTFPFQDRERLSPYDHRFHMLVRELASRLGQEGGCLDEVIKHCGSVLVDIRHCGLSPAEIQDPYELEWARVTLQQMFLLAEEYVCRKPSDIIGLCWRGELARRERDEELALEYADRIWVATSSASAKTIQRVTTFFALTGQMAGVWDDWGWRGLSSYSLPLGEIKGTWIDRSQPLAWAIVRRGFQQGTWDTSLLCSMDALREDGCWPESGDAPVQCWAWLAPHSINQLYFLELYYSYWTLAFESLQDTTDPTLAHNVIVAVLLGRLLNQVSANGLPPIQRVLMALNALHRRYPSMPEKERAALEMVNYVYRKLKPDHLTATAADHLTATAADRLAIETALERLKIPTQSQDEIGPHLQDGVEGNLKSRLGEALWAKLSEAAKSEFTHGEFYYQFASAMEGEKGDFRSFVMAYSGGLLAEIQESLRGSLTRNSSLRREFRDQFGGEEHPEWGELIRYMDNIDKNAATPLGTALMAQGIQLHRLGNLRESFEYMKDIRNKAAHTKGKERIDREEAAVLHDRFFNKRLIKNVVDIFHKLPRR